MIDIIIPVYNSFDFLDRALSSLVCQLNAVDFKVYIIDDASTCDYDSIIDFYSKSLNIIYDRLDKNVGPGGARKHGVDISSGKYIIFLDSDDIFASPLTVFDLFSFIEDGYDVVCSVVLEQLDNGFNLYKNDNVGLHGKIYRRSFLSLNDINFTGMRSNEDNAFNSLIKLCGGKYGFLDRVTYFWCNNKRSLTRVDPFQNFIIDMNNYCSSTLWALNESIQRNIFSNIELFCIEFFISIYNRYSSFDYQLIYDNINESFKDVYNIYDKYKSDDIDNVIINNALYEDYHSIVDDFHSFIEVMVK